MILLSSFFLRSSLPPTPEGKPRFKRLDSTGHLCCYCKDVLREAMQTACGHHMCEACVDRLFESPTTGPIRCPAKEEDCDDLTREKVSLFL